MPRAQVRARADDGARLDFDDDAAFAYGYAHHVFATVARCGGPAAVLAVVDRCQAGVDVQQALRLSPRRLLDDECP
jgi:hypothetical protein